jgi:hypothetical protein
MSARLDFFRVTIYYLVTQCPCAIIVGFERLPLPRQSLACLINSIDRTPSFLAMLATLPAPIAISSERGSAGDIAIPGDMIIADGESIR